MNQPKTGRRAQAGFTLVEIMVVIVILGLLATMVATNVIGASDEARIQTSRTSAKVIHDAITMFYTRNGKLPDSLEDLVSTEVKGGPFLERLENDAWDNEFILRGETRTDFEVISMGPDGQEGTEDDISSRKKDE
ncbi:MAG: type II secretion system protein GspG [Planctomycetes bacterium]|nr:type II secretion system protein GspG [Planctomycetota bacterium]